MLLMQASEAHDHNIGNLRLVCSQKACLQSIPATPGFFTSQSCSDPSIVLYVGRVFFLEVK